MTEEQNFKYDPEAEQNQRNLRLPFGLCKTYGIEIQDWWTPKDAWRALQKGGHVDDVSEEYAEFYRKLKRERQKEYRQRAKNKAAQLRNPEHNPDYNYQHENGKIAGVEKGKEMTFEQADSGHCNPNFGREDLIGYRHNCQTCVAVYYARRLGYDVRALPNLNNRNIYNLSVDTSLAYRTAEGRHPLKHAVAGGAKGLKAFAANNLKNGEIAAVSWRWKERNSGHIIICEKDNSGNLRLYDPQTNMSHKAESWAPKGSNFNFTKLSGCTLDEEFCDRIMKKETKK